MTRPSDPEQAAPITAGDLAAWWEGVPAIAELTPEVRDVLRRRLAAARADYNTAVLWAAGLAAAAGFAAGAALAHRGAARAFARRPPGGVLLVLNHPAAGTPTCVRPVNERTR